MGVKNLRAFREKPFPRNVNHALHGFALIHGVRHHRFGSRRKADRIFPAFAYTDVETTIHQAAAVPMSRVIMARVKETKGFNEMHSKMLIALPAIRRIRTFFVLGEIRENAPLSF